MITLGFVCGWAGTITLDVPISFPKPSIKATTYIHVGDTGGDISFVNPNGVTQLWKAATPGLNPIAAIQINTSGTTADVVGWSGSVQY